MKIPNKGIVLVKVDEPREQDDNGLFIQEEWKTQPPTGIVLEVGDGVTFVKPGDKVFFERYSAIQTPFSEDIKACKEESILVKFDDKG